MDDAPLSSLICTRRSTRIRERQEANSKNGSPSNARPTDRRAKRTRACKRDHESLIEVIKGDGKYIPEVVRHWVERYEKEPRTAKLELFSMLFQACGGKCNIKEEAFDQANVDDVVVALVDLARNGEVEDYQSSKSKEFKKFKENLVSFWNTLVVGCQHGPLFDGVLFDTCMDYIIALACTPPRIHRQVALPIGLQLVTSFISVAKTLGEQLNTAQRQFNARRAKAKKGHLVEQLKDRLSRTHERINLTKQMMEKIFSGLFKHRYRDVDPNIRMMCMESLGIWICSYPEFFLRDEHLKYLGWMLNDKSAGVRKVSVLALKNLYDHVSTPDLTEKFCQKFSKRIVELVDDVDDKVAVSSVGLIKQLVRHHLLPDDNLEPLYDGLHIDDNPEIRHAIGELLYNHLIAQNLKSFPSDPEGNDSQIHLGRMLHILRKCSTNSILSLYVIDDVWDHMKAMQDWKCIISMLLDENPLVELTEEDVRFGLQDWKSTISTLLDENPLEHCHSNPFKLTAEDVTNLIRLLSASVRKAVGEKIVPIDNRKQCHNKAQREIFENNRHDITIAMMKKYPSLLHKFLADKARVPLLLEIIMHMNLELYSLKGQEKDFTMLVQRIKEAFFIHGEKDTLRSCVKAIQFCYTGSAGELQDLARNKLKDLEDELITKLKSAIKEDGQDEYTLLVNSKRFYELQLSRPLLTDCLYKDIITFLQSYRNLNDEVTAFLLLNVYLHVAWSLNTIINGETVSESSLFSLLAKRDTLFEELEYFLNIYPKVGEDNKSQNVLACRVCTILADLWCMFRKKEFSSTKLEMLGYCPSTLILQKFWGLCEQLFNISDETEDEDAHQEYVEETNRDAAMIAAAKLIVTNTVPKEFLAPKVISNFVIHGISMAEIVRSLIKVLKENDNDISNIFLEALKMAYQRFKELSETDDESLRWKTFQDCKDLATQLSGTFKGAAHNEQRSEIVKIVKEGIEHAFEDAPKQLSFLEAAVSYFISKLPISDVQDIQKDVEKRMENVHPDEDPSRWSPYHTFYNALKASKQ